MGNNVPRQTEGAVGDITVRDISVLGLKCYIKTNSGWYDINTMQSADKTSWIDMNLENSWATDATYGAPQYFRDMDGFVHFRGGCDSGTLASGITTLPKGFRPTFAQRRLVTRVVAVGTLYIQVINISALGVVNRPAAFEIVDDDVTWDGSEGVDLDTTTEVCLDGISFFAGQKIIGSGGGSTSSSSSRGEGAGGGSGGVAK